MEVILKEDIVNLGHRGDLVKVADGYGRNFLLPRKLALQATETNKAVVEQMKNAAARRAATEKALAEALVIKLEPVVLDFTRKSGEAGHLFGSVTSADIATALEAKGFEIDRRKIQLDEPLKTVGDFSVAIKLYREVTAHIKVNVMAEATEEAPVEAAAGAVAASPLPQPNPKRKHPQPSKLYSTPRTRPPLGSPRGGRVFQTADLRGSSQRFTSQDFALIHSMLENPAPTPSPVPSPPNIGSAPMK